MALLLSCVAGDLILSVLAVILSGWRRATPIVYGGTLVISAILSGIALFAVAQSPMSITLPLGLPWLGAHFRLDALAAAFLLIVNFGGTGVSLYALGYGRHEPEPGRVLPFYPVFLAAMNLVVIAADAYSFLLAWEMMSLASWALVDRAPPHEWQFARRLYLSADGERRHVRPALLFRPARWRARQLRLRGDPRASSRSKPCGISRWLSPSSARARRRASYHSTSGCHSPIPPPRAMSRR